jgi:hypothetical protein
MSHQVTVQILYSPYAAQVIEEIMSLRSQVGLKVARLWRQDHGCFGDPRHPPDAELRHMVRRYIADTVGGVQVHLRDILEDDEAIEAFAWYRYFYHIIREQFQPEIQALQTLLARVLASPKRKYVRHALQLPKFATPELHQASLRTALLWWGFVNMPEEPAGVAEADDGA